MLVASGPELYTALADLGWHQMLAEIPEVAVPLVFRLLGETGAHAPLLNDVLRDSIGRPAIESVPLPFAGGRWVLWEEIGGGSSAIDAELPIREVPAGDEIPLAVGRRALGWWLVGTSRAMLALAKTHAMHRVQFDRPVASFQAVRHRLAEALVATEGAEATLQAADSDLGALLAKAAAGRAALTAARHCQQVLGGIGFTAEHDLHRHIRRVLVLDCLLGSSRELIRDAGAMLRTTGNAPRLVHL
ncbi:acyl-CoA/acyl-ACP dehydrogenase [Nocardia sp. NBC_01730]|uniref:acyl-CoA dehydrogenase family protein n=1 Tax=Nocardia sp. NBC_01730 TaxID=2975998 RepID=UPI002E112D0B|nr:acyl-CoA/acyl-ACP dehydrogenase [Nocardia sp. NBC_01730]